MSFAFPWVMAFGAAVAAGVVALHLLSTRRPPARPLPTARFVPASDARAVSRTSRPTDLLLLALRVLAVLLIAAAFAQPIPDAPGPAVRRVVALEWTTALAEPESLRTRAQALLGEGDALVVFDTSARVVPVADLATLPAPTVRGVALSPMFVAVRDAAGMIARGADSLAVTVIGGFPAESWDAATPSLRGTWPGRIDVELAESSVDTSAPAVEVLPADADDPLAAAVPIASARSLAATVLAGSPRAGSSRGSVRLRRGLVTPDDSAWLARTPDAVLLQWPRDSAADVAPDGVLAQNGANAAMVAPLARLELSGDATAQRVIARWRDGTPAATERISGAGCVREVAIGVPERGDVTLRAPFAALLDVLFQPCGGRRGAATPDSLRATLAGAGPLAVASRFTADRAGSPWTPWLLLAAVLLLLAEQWYRRRAPVVAA